MSPGELRAFFDGQLGAWPEAAGRYAALMDVRQRMLTVDGVEYTLQYNPARSISTMAKVDPISVAARPCFLCGGNRPPLQRAIAMLDGKYELLVNPFPIFIPHFTLPATTHTPQSLSARLRDMARLATELPFMAIFYNGPRCGASAPDHMHFQAVDRQVLPLIRNIGSGNAPAFPHKVIHLRGTDSLNDIDIERTYPDVNVIAWVGEEINVVVIPRRSHRPACYGDEGLMVSPATIDLCGVVVTPRERDFESMTASQLKEIIRDVTFRQD